MQTALFGAVLSVIVLTSLVSAPEFDTRLRLSIPGAAACPVALRTLLINRLSYIVTSAL
jgi:hypothetical protein